MKQNGIAKPDWLKVTFPAGENYRRIDQYHRLQGLNSVCRSAACPNQGECWNKGTATFMILGNRCTRTCSFCNIGDHPTEAPDPREPQKVAQAIAELRLNHAVITSVTRDDLPDGGAGQFAALVREIKKRSPHCTIELLIPDLQGDKEALATILQEAPHILGHNLETVPRLYPQVRPEADYHRSLNVLTHVRTLAPTVITKSGLMLGMGEEYAEVITALHDLRDHGCRIVTLGQYLAPTRQHYQLKRYVTPAEFDDLAAYGRRLGFDHVEAGPLVRSSYHAEEQFSAGKAQTHG
ncbi:lipoyl synthase [Pelovirga terrestris]|uniref:Lipoyl synthase n=1 Tax=Pelovirga terrestris TaxID=2771352 RepID=A0A8J6QWH1_9BACT|nr:lipoyl synthase [Pelovirga terrestris]MBD1399693.1 lipoyl synthase [Pelovirga terrestris]